MKARVARATGGSNPSVSAKGELLETIQQRDLRNDSGKVLAAVEAGESFTITRNGKPVAELKPLTRRTFVPVAELARTSAHLPRIAYDEWRADMDAMIDQEIADGE